MQNKCKINSVLFVQYTVNILKEKYFYLTTANNNNNANLREK